MIDTIPEVEAQLNRLNRDYEVVKRQHDALLERLESARLADQVQIDNEGVSFDILEPAREPLVPASPDRLLLNLLALVAGLGLGGFVAFVMNRLDPVFFSPTHLKQSLNVPVFGTLPRAASAPVLDERRPFAMAAGGLLVACAVIMVVGSQGLEPLQKWLAG
jgi:hypothetical protein